jgi:hypothetical protein
LQYLAHVQSDGWSEATDAGLFEKERFRVVNTGLVYGATYEFRRFDAGLRFNHGLYDIGKNTEPAGYEGALQTRNSFLQVYGAYVF